MPNSPGIGAGTPARQTLTLEHAGGPLVLDLWEPEQPSGSPPILLVHGWGASSSYWRLTAEALAQTSRVIVPDLPGTGRSQPVASPQGMFDQAASLRRILDELALEQVHVVGHSMGGAMGILLSDWEPERIARLVLTSLCLFTSNTERQFFRTLTQTFRITMALRKTPLAEIPLFAKAMTSRYFYRMPARTDLVRQLYRDFLELDAASAISCAAGAVDPEIDLAASRLVAPTLLIVCRQDRLMPIHNVNFTARLIPRCDVHWLEGSGHLPMLERPDEYVGLLRGFLEREGDSVRAADPTN